MHFDRDSKVLFNYWQELHGFCRGVPMKSSLNPARIKQILPYLYIIERLNDGEIYLRLAGTALDQLAGFPMTDKNLIRLVGESDRDFYAEIYRQLCSTPCGTLLERVLFLDQGDCFETQTLSVPLADTNGDVLFAAGVMAGRRLFTPGGGIAVVGQSLFKSFQYLDLGYGKPEREPELPTSNDGWPKKKAITSIAALGLDGE